VTTSVLMAELRARGHAGGVVLGYTAARAEEARGHLKKTWKDFRKAEPFWPEFPATVQPAEATDIAPA